MSYILFLDDIRFPADVQYFYGNYSDIIICRSMDDAVWVVKHRGLPHFISFDHDLADGHYSQDSTEKTGYTFAKWFGDYVLDNGFTLREDFGYYVHSMNPVGAKNIDMYMKNFLKVYKNDD